MDVWVITLVNDQLDVMEDEVTYDESAVDRIADDMRSIAKPSEHVAVTHAIMSLPWEKEL